MEFLNAFYIKILLPILSQLITVDIVLMMGLTIGTTEFIKQGFKHYEKVKSLDNWTIRVVSIIFGVFFSLIILTSYSLKMKIIYGLFYSFVSPILYWVGKRFLNKYFPTVNKLTSGQ